LRLLYGILSYFSWLFFKVSISLLISSFISCIVFLISFVCILFKLI
jgi:hypothetical protein